MTTTDTQGKLVTNDNKIYHVWKDASTDGTEIEAKIRDIAGKLKSVGTALKGKRLRYIGLQCSDGSILTTAKLLNGDGGTLASWRGNERTTQVHYNLEADNLDLAIDEGTVLNINTGD